jgi:hypothetical protein
MSVVGIYQQPNVGCIGHFGHGERRSEKGVSKVTLLQDSSLLFASPANQNDRGRDHQ